MTDNYDYSAFAGVGHNYPPDEMAEVKRLAEAQLVAEQEVEELEKKLEEAKARLKDISNYKIPDKMESLGITSYTTPEGMVVEVEEKVRGGLLVENKAKGHNWLEEKGHGAILKTEVSISFPKSKLEEAKKLTEKLRDEKLPANLERSVHHQTLDAFIREQLERGKEIPLDIFSVMRQKTTSVTKPKKESI